MHLEGWICCWKTRRYASGVCRVRSADPSVVPSIFWNLVKPVETIIPCQKAVVIELKSVKKNEDIGMLMLKVLWMPSLYEHVRRFVFDEA